MNYLDEKFEDCVRYTAELIKILSLARKRGDITVGTFDTDLEEITDFHLDRREIYGSNCYKVSPFKKVKKYHLFNYGDCFTTFRFYKDIFWKTTTGKLFIKRVSEEILKSKNIKLKCSWGGAQTLMKIKFVCK